jgi:hypothetical protein
MQSPLVPSAPLLHAVTDVSSSTDPAALTVPPLDTRAATHAWERPIAAVIPPVEALAKTAASFPPEDSSPPGPLPFQPLLVLGLRV